MVLTVLDTAPSDPAAPTTAEITAGTNVTGSKTAEELTRIAGFEPSPGVLNAGGYAGPKSSTLVGETTYPLAELEWLADTGSSTIKTFVDDEGTDKWFVFSHEGTGSGNPTVVVPGSIAVFHENLQRNTPHTFKISVTHDPPVRGTQAA